MKNPILVRKILAFEYVVFKLIDWYKSFNGVERDVDFNSDNDFSKLKVFKLHFFTSAIKSDSNQLLSVFNNFYAMPFGHVESDIYDYINELERFEIDVKATKIKGPYLDILHKSFSELDGDIKSEIDEAIDVLFGRNNELINLSAMDLVELSHQWYSWKFTFDKAQSDGKFSERILPELIKSEYKYILL